jgi:hypothetical protein
MAALERLAQSRDDTAFVRSPVAPGDLVMREPINRKTKLHPKWDGPFVVLESTDTDVYKLATANGYIIKNLVNQARLRKLNADECKQYTGEFWEASARLRSQDKQAKQGLEPKHPITEPKLLDSIRVERPPKRPSKTPDPAQRIRRLPWKLRTSG